MGTDLDAALQCYCSYFRVSYFDVVYQGNDSDQVWVGIKHWSDGSTDIVFRGSTLLIDWERDFKANMITDPNIGEVENGFFIGLPELLPRLLKEIANSKKVRIIGHSLGAGRALIMGAFLVAAGIVPQIMEIITFGSPRPGGQKLKDILAPVDIRSYKHGFDPVTNVPLMLSIDPYIHPRDLIQVTAEPISPDPWIVFRDHHIQYYINALALKIGGYQ